MSLVDPRQRAKELIEQAERALSQGLQTGAVAFARQAVATAPDWRYAHVVLGQMLTFNHDYWHNAEQCQQLLRDGVLDEAIASWHRAVSTGFEDDWTQLCYAHALTAKGQYKQAAVQLRRGIEYLIRAKRPDYVREHWAKGAATGPDFLIIGATKCGTTSLYEYMCEHPQVLPAIWKEIEYFRFPERGVEWYLSHFPRVPDGGTRYLSGEASTCYMSIFDAKTAVRAQFPNTKLIALVRDPVGKAISHFHHDVKIGCEHRSYEQALTRELDVLEGIKQPLHDSEYYWKTERGYVWLGMYVYFLENWLTAFPREQLLVIPSEDLYGKPAETLTKVFQFLGLPDHRLAKYDVHLQGNYEKKADDPMRERLKRFFAPHNERLEQLLGRQLDWQKP